jgi:hypothetical protein
MWPAVVSSIPTCQKSIWRWTTRHMHVTDKSRWPSNDYHRDVWTSSIQLDRWMQCRAVTRGRSAVLHSSRTHRLLYRTTRQSTSRTSGSCSKTTTWSIEVRLVHLNTNRWMLSTRMTKQTSVTCRAEMCSTMVRTRAMYRLDHSTMFEELLRRKCCRQKQSSRSMCNVCNWARIY